MKCRKCGNPVREADQRCTVCGARVIKEPLSFSKRKKRISPMDTGGIEESGFQGYIPPEEQFGWNTDGFPGKKKPTKDIEFNWNTFDQFHQNKAEKISCSQRDEIAFGEDLFPESKEEIKAEKVVWNEPFEIPTPPEKVTESFPEKQEKSPEVYQQPEEQNQATEPAAEEEPELLEAMPVEDIPGRENDITGKQLEKDIFEEIRKEQHSTPTPVSMTDAMAAHTVSTEETDHGQVDQFYTFNRKNEEFQRLLDKEYEKYRSGRRDSDWEPETEEYSPAACEQDVLISPEAQIPAYLAALLKEQEPERQAENNTQEIKAKAAEPSDPQKAEDAQPDNRETAGQEKLAEPAATKIPETAEKIAAEQDKTKSSESKESSLSKPEKSADMPESVPPKKTKKSRPWIMIILIIVLAVLTLLAVALVAPNSPPGTLVHSIFSSSKAEKQEPVPVKAGSKEAAKDKTGVIQLIIKDQQSLSLTKVAYSSKLQYKDGQVYKDKNIDSSKPLKKNRKYMDDRGNKIPLDEALIKAAIDYADSHMKLRGKDKVLKIGEIRYTGKKYYIWVSENNIKKIYRIDDSKGILRVSGIVQM